MSRGRLVLLLALVLLPGSSAAQSLSVRDLIELTKAGLSEPALLALIEVNRTVFPVDVETLKSLREAGVPPNVITAMIRSGRTAPPPPAALPVASEAEPSEPLAPSVVVIEREAPVREVVVPVAVPVYVAVPVGRSHRRDGDYRFGHGEDPRANPPVPVYWGWGGKLRPDAWKPAVELQKDAKVPREPQRR